jgi:hypothetical protein
MHTFQETKTILIDISPLWLFLKFELKNVGVRTSGAKATFRGAIQYYEIGVGEIISLEKKNEKEYHFLEKYSETIYRLSIIKFEEIS